VKTAISVPDRSFERVRRHAARLGISRSEFFTRAAERWADQLDDAELTASIDDTLDQIGDGPDDNAAFLYEAAVRTVTDEPS